MTAGAGTAGRRDRLVAAAGRVRAAARLLPGEALTDPDPNTGERWDRGQVLAHVAEMLPYWAHQVELVAAGDQVAFGRVVSDPGRVAAIVDRFLVGHLEEHADQLEAGRRGGNG
jgi:hypothetical protein